MLTAKVIVTGENVVNAKLLLAAPRILAHNIALTNSMLESVKDQIQPATPLGPGHFGFHLRDTYRIDVKANRAQIVTYGVVRSAVQGYWREYGTRAGFKKAGGYNKRSKGATLDNFMAYGMDGGGERATHVAHKALNRARAIIRFYYGGMAEWWKL